MIIVTTARKIVYTLKQFGQTLCFPDVKLNCYFSNCSVRPQLSWYQKLTDITKKSSN